VAVFAGVPVLVAFLVLFALVGFGQTVFACNIETLFQLRESVGILGLSFPPGIRDARLLGPECWQRPSGCTLQLVDYTDVA